MKKHIIRLTIGLTALVASFLPQKAAADCVAQCGTFDWCSASGDDARCWCEGFGQPRCESP